MSAKTQKQRSSYVNNRNRALVRLFVGATLGFLIIFSLCYFWMVYKNNVGPVSGLGALFLSSLGAVFGALASLFSKKWNDQNTIMERTQKILEKIECELSGLEFKQNDRNNLSAALFDLSLDHANGIIALFSTKKPNIPSGYALVRPMFECFVRGAWLQYCASDKQIEKIIRKDSFPLTFAEMLDAVEKQNKWPATLTEIMKRAMKNMHSYTHGGMQIISRRFKDGVLEHVLDEKEISDVLTFIVLLAYLSFCQIVSITGTTAKDEFIKSLFTEITDCYLGGS